MAVVVLVDAEVIPSHPGSGRPAFNDIDKAVAGLAPVVVEQLGPAVVALEKLVAQAYAAGQLHHRIVTGFMPEHDTVRLSLPGDDDSVIGIHIRVRRAGLQLALVTADGIIADLTCGNARQCTSLEFGQLQRQRFLEDGIGAGSMARDRCVARRSLELSRVRYFACPH